MQYTPISTTSSTAQVSLHTPQTKQTSKYRVAQRNIRVYGGAYRRTENNMYQGEVLRIVRHQLIRVARSSAAPLKKEARNVTPAVQYTR